MTSNWNWNRPEDGADGPDSQPTANPPEPLGDRGDQAPPPWSSAAGSGASSVQGHGQSPWDRPAAEGTGAEQSYGQTPWDRPVSPSRRAADDEGYGQNPWDRAGSTSAGPARGEDPQTGSGTRFGQATPPQGAPTSGFGATGYPGSTYGSAPYAGPQSGSPYTAGAQPGSPYGAGPYGSAPGGALGYGAAGASNYGMQPYGFGGPQVPARPRMGFIQAMTAWMQNYARFNGRAGLSEYWWTVLGNAVVVLVLELLMVTAGQGADGSYNTFGLLVAALIGIWSLVTLVPNLAVAVRRLHDTNRSGLTYLFNFIPFVGGIIVLVFTLGGSNPAGARFDGPDQPRTGD